MNNANFYIEFFGVRGSLPRCEKNMSFFGGNTSCIKVTIDNTLLIFDGGTGLYNLGESLNKDNSAINGHLFFTHLHWDHIQGVPFFSPFHNHLNKFILYGEDKNNVKFETLMQNLMKRPYFPITWNSLSSNIEFQSISSDETLSITPEISISTLRLNHPDGSIGFKINSKDKSFCYITDNEHNDAIDKSICEFCQNVDLLVYDTNFTEEEYKTKKGWGHSTWEKAVDIAIKSKAKQLILFHHDLNRSDEEIFDIERSAQKIFPNSIAAYENLMIKL